MAVNQSGFPIIPGIFKQHVKMSQIIAVAKTGKKKKSFIFCEFLCPLLLYYYDDCSQVF